MVGAAFCYPTFDYSTGWNQFCPGTGFVFGTGSARQCLEFDKLVIVASVLLPLRCQVVADHRTVVGHGAFFD